MNVGGQAVIEGVMMRGKKGVATALRRKDGSITLKTEKCVSYSQKYKILGLPILRGAVALIESMVMGFKWINYSADIAIEDEEIEDRKPKQKESSFAKFLHIAIAVIIGISVFMALPYYITSLVPFTKQGNPVFFNLLAGTIRISFFLIYVYALSFINDVDILFKYHGAEHKVIACYEHKEELTPSNAKKYTTLHPRCGTSFLLIAAISCVLVFAIIDAWIGTIWSVYLNPSWYLRVGVHLTLIPLVSGISYEILKFTGKHDKNKFVKILSLPGLGLQKITTKEPNKKQLEVAIASLKGVLNLS